MSVLLRVEDLWAGYGDGDIVRGASIEADSGRMVALIGPNGAGKSTLLKAVTGLLRPRKGRVLLAGTDVAGLAPEEIIARGLGYVPQTGNVFPSLTVGEHLRLRGADASARDWVLSLFPALAERLRRSAGDLSGGERQMLAVARALTRRPKLLLLDEPSAALAPVVVRLLFERIVAVARSGVGVLLVEQNVRAALPVCDHAYALVLGANAIDGPGPALLDDPRLHDVYLGTAPEGEKV